jgi:hypothetical protein
MTPQEKAIELFSNYRFILSIPNAPLGELKDDIAKQCALIAVDEILTADMFMMTEEQEKYWEQVKQEIEKL